MMKPMPINTATVPRLIFGSAMMRMPMTMSASPPRSRHPRPSPLTMIAPIRSTRPVRISQMPTARTIASSASAGCRMTTTPAMTPTTPTTTRSVLLASSPEPMVPAITSALSSRMLMPAMIASTLSVMSGQTSTAMPQAAETRPVTA